MLMLPPIEELRRRSMLALVVGGWVIVLTLAALSLASSQYQFAPPATALAALINAVPTWMVLTGRVDSIARLSFGVQAGLIPALLFYALQGTLWQPELLLLLAAGLVALVTLCDHRPILIASTLLALQHVGLVSFAPQWIADEEMHIGLSSIRLGATILGGAILSWITVLLRTAIEISSELQTELKDCQKTLGAKNTELAALETNLAAEKASKARALEEVIEQRKAEYEEVAAAFEKSMASVTTSVTATARLLEESAHQLKLNADQTGNEALRVLSSAETASRAANTVAAGLAELSVSIAEVVDDAGQQSSLSKDASVCSGDGSQAIEKLSAQSQTIGEATHSIVRIAERTNLLSLNAAIEAASAGPAGRGFSIVANEVKQLADQASDAANRIQEFLGGVQSGTLEAELSFHKIETAISELDRNAKSIRYNVENHRQSAGTIETFARGAADDADEMVKHSRALAERATRSKLLSDEVDEAVVNLADHVRQLEQSSRQFRSKLDVA